ncbi:MAG: VanZ family protein [Lachnospiraceae bacterium]|nr:VanZ family protein [Lachnospiraceae bacterium]
MTQETARRIRLTGAVLFILYFAALEYMLLFSERSVADQIACNLVPFREIRRFIQYAELIGMKNVLINLVGNVVGFCPFGAILPILYRKLRSGWRMIGLTALFSVGMELIQLLTRVGSCDIDDVILNTLGGAIGFCVFAVCDRMRRHIWPV